MREIEILTKCFQAFDCQTVSVQRSVRGGMVRRETSCSCYTAS